MRKYVIGFIVGAFAFMAAQVSADGIKELVGIKVGSVWELYVDGEQVGDVPIIKGSSYGPIRQIADIVGMGVEFETGKVYLSTGEGMQVDSTIADIEAKLSEKKQLYDAIEKIMAADEKAYKDGIVYDPNVTAEYHQIYEKNRQVEAERLAALEKEIAELEDELIKLETAQ